MGVICLDESLVNKLWNTDQKLYVWTRIIVQSPLINQFIWEQYITDDLELIHKTRLPLPEDQSILGIAFSNRAMESFLF